MEGAADDRAWLGPDMLVGEPAGPQTADHCLPIMLSLMLSLILALMLAGHSLLARPRTGAGRMQVPDAGQCGRWAGGISTSR